MQHYNKNPFTSKGIFITSKLSLALYKFCFTGCFRTGKWKRQDIFNEVVTGANFIIFQYIYLPVTFLTKAGCFANNN